MYVLWEMYDKVIVLAIKLLAIWIATTGENKNKVVLGCNVFWILSIRYMNYYFLDEND